jgi:hypothetical protein
VDLSSYALLKGQLIYGWGHTSTQNVSVVTHVARRDVRCRNRKKPIDPNIRGTRALLDGRQHCSISPSVDTVRLGPHERTKYVRCNANTS